MHLVGWLPRWHRIREAMALLIYEPDSVIAKRDNRVYLHRSSRRNPAG
jgi:hypothetical protein